MKLKYELSNVISITGDELERLRQQKREIEKQEKKLIKTQLKALRLLGVFAFR